MRYIFLGGVMVLLMVATGWSQACDSGVWTQTNQQPSTCVPYSVNGIFGKRLPNAGNGGPLNNLAPNEAAIVSRVLTDANRITQSIWGQTTIASAGLSEWLDVPMYYGRPSDPIYKVPASACLNNTRCGMPGSPNDVRETYWHIPNKAKWSG